MIEKMSKVTIVTPKEDLDNLLKVIIKCKLLHLKNIESNMFLNEIQEFNLNKDELHFLNTLYKDLDRFFESYNKINSRKNSISQQNLSYDKSKTLLLQLQEDQAKWKQDISLIEQNENILSQYESLVQNFQQIIPNLSFDSDLNVRGILISNPTYDTQTILEKTLKNKTNGNYHLKLHQVSLKLTIGSITYPKIYDQAMKEILEKLSITDVVLPKELPGKTIGEKIRNFEIQIESNKEKKQQLYMKLDVLYERYLSLNPHKQFIFESYFKLEGLKYLKVSEYFVVLEAFIPSKKVDLLREILKSQLSTAFKLNVEEKITNAPIKISNRRGIREFEVFTGMVQPIAYNTVDPTLFMAIVFPLFYGFIIGDVGYGLIISALGFFLYRKYYNFNGDMKNISNLGWVFFVSGLSSIFFGFLFGEFFGNLAETIGLHPLLYHRNESIMELLLIAIFVGILHVMFGFTLGILNAKRIGDRHKFISNLGYFLTLLGFISLALSMVEFSESTFQTTSIAIILIGMIILIRFDGIIALIELISYIGNMLSYARLMALGIASVILADIANEFYFIIGGGIIGIIMVLLMHTLNIAIAMFSPLIHSMRLHLVEFFSKFVYDGTEQYHPFGETI